MFVYYTEEIGLLLGYYMKYMLTICYILKYRFIHLCYIMECRLILLGCML